MEESSVKKNNCNCYLMCTLKKESNCRFYQPGDKLDFKDGVEVYQCAWTDSSSWCFNTAANYNCLMAYLHGIYKNIEEQLEKKESDIAVLRNRIVQREHTNYPVGGKKSEKSS